MIYLKANIVALATVRNWRFSSRSGLQPNWNLCTGLYRIQKLNPSEPTVFWPVPYFCKLGTLAPNKYLSSDCITIWYICKRCSFWCSFTSHPQMCDPITIRWVTLKITQIPAPFHRNLMNSDQIPIWRRGGERASKTASFMYISYCDTIWTYILNWNQSCEIAKMRLCCMINPAKNRGFMSCLGYNPAKTERFGFLDSCGTEPNRTVLPVQSRATGGLPGPVPFTT